MPCHLPVVEGLVSGSCKIPTSFHPIPPILTPLIPQTVPWPQTPDPVSAFLEPGCETGLSFVVSTSGRAGLVSADYSRALGQPGSAEEAQLQKNTELGYRESYGGQKPSLLAG